MTKTEIRFIPTGSAKITFCIRSPGVASSLSFEVHVRGKRNISVLAEFPTFRTFSALLR